MAQIKIRFVNFERSPALETFTRMNLEALERRLDRRPGKAKAIEVQYRLDAKAPLGSLKNSEVSIHYRYPGVKELHVKKKGVDLRKVLKDAIKTTETAIRRASEKSEGGRRTLGKSKRSVRRLREKV